MLPKVEDLFFNTSHEIPEVLFEIVNLHGEKVYEKRFVIEKNSNYEKCNNPFHSFGA